MLNSIILTAQLTIHPPQLMGGMDIRTCIRNSKLWWLDIYQHRLSNEYQTLTDWVLLATHKPHIWLGKGMKSYLWAPLVRLCYDMKMCKVKVET